MNDDSQSTQTVKSPSAAGNRAACGNVLPSAPATSPATAATKIADLRTRLARILVPPVMKGRSGYGHGFGQRPHDDIASHFTFGVDRIDHGLRGNGGAPGLPRAALHELHAAQQPDRTSAAAMALLLAERCRNPDHLSNKNIRPLLWISESGEARRHGRLYPPGLAELGIDPASIIHVDAPDSIAALRAAADGIRSAAMAAVIIELTGRKPKGLDMTATRRLTLSAQQTGILALLLRHGSDLHDPLPTAAFSRWQVAAAPSTPLAANAPGHSIFDISLMRHRSGLYGLNARLEWHRDDHQFREQQSDQGTAVPGTMPALSAERADHRGVRAA